MTRLELGCLRHLSIRVCVCVCVYVRGFLRMYGCASVRSCVWLYVFMAV